MYHFDQNFRKLIIEHRNNDQLKWLSTELNVFHTNEVGGLEVHGWITISKFSSEYDQKAWLLIQHADIDTFFQAGILFLLQNLAKIAETDQTTLIFMISVEWQQNFAT